VHNLVETFLSSERIEYHFTVIKEKSLTQPKKVVFNFFNIFHGKGTNSEISLRAIQQVFNCWLFHP
jgi:hypothetical protein